MEEGREEERQEGKQEGREGGKERDGGGEEELEETESLLVTLVMTSKAAMLATHMGKVWEKD